MKWSYFGLFVWILLGISFPQEDESLLCSPWYLLFHNGDVSVLIYIQAMPFGSGSLHSTNTLNEEKYMSNFISQNEHTKAELSKLIYSLIKQD